jgi:hypothetical protein
MGKSKNTRVVDEGMMLSCAETFHEIGISFFEEIATDLPEGTGGETPPPALGALVASATNLAFALELYLKTLRVRDHLPYVATHDLWELFQGLPAGTKSRIEAHYDRDRKSGARSRRARITIAKGPIETPEWSEFDRQPEGLEPMLKRSKNAFSSWRYVFEVAIPEDSQYQFHAFEYRLLDCACNAVKAIVRDLEDESDEKSK